MIVPKNLEELATYVEKGKNVFFFTADWIEDGKELGRLVNKDRKTKAEIESFLSSLN